MSRNMNYKKTSKDFSSLKQQRLKNLLKYITDYSNQHNDLFSSSAEDRKNCVCELQQRRFLPGNGGEKITTIQVSTNCSEELVKYQRSLEQVRLTSGKDTNSLACFGLAYLFQSYFLDFRADRLIHFSDHFFKVY